MRALIKRISLQNFKGCKEKVYDFAGKNAGVNGANASGKTTILDAFWWCLFNKDSLGNEKFAIRPLDADGKQIDNLEIKVSVVLDVNGREMEFTKTQKQKWVKKRNSAVAELQGNENLYEIDGYPKTEKDYKSAIADLVSEDVFKMVTNPVYFPSLKWKDQRDILMRFATDSSDYDLASGKPEFAGLLEELQKAPSTDDIKAKYQKALTEWKKKQAEIPVRIDEAEKSKVDIDVAELELGKKAILELIKSNKDKQDDVSKQIDEYKHLSDEIIELKFAESDLVRKANEGNIKKRSEIEDKISDKKFLIKQVEQTIRDTERDILNSKGVIQRKEFLIEDARNSYRTAQKRTFDENSLVCAYCGQEYPAEKKEELRVDFEKHKSEELKKITELGNEVKGKLDVEKETLRTLELELSEHKKSLEMLNADKDELEKQLSELSTNVDVSQTDEYKAIQSKIAEKETAMSQMNSADDVRRSLEEESRELNGKLLEIEKQIAKSEQNVEIDERIKQLETEQKEVAQKVADQEKMLYLLEQFIRYKMDAVSESINSKFEGICWKLFENQINGGLKETCELTVNGVPYGSLNNGHRIIAGLQIIKALQGLYEVSMPVFIDNAESVNDFNLPSMDCQLICMRVTDDKDVIVEV